MTRHNLFSKTAGDFWWYEKQWPLVTKAEQSNALMQHRRIKQNAVKHLNIFFTYYHSNVNTNKFQCLMGVIMSAIENATHSCIALWIAVWHISKGNKPQTWAWVSKSLRACACIVCGTACYLTMFNSASDVQWSLGGKMFLYFIKVHWILGYSFILLFCLLHILTNVVGHILHTQKMCILYTVYIMQMSPVKWEVQRYVMTNISHRFKNR